MLLLHDGDRIQGHCTPTLSDHGKENRFLLHHVLLQFRFQGEQRREQLSEHLGLTIAVRLEDLASHELQARQLLLQRPMIGGQDMVDQIVQIGFVPALLIVVRFRELRPDLLEDLFGVQA